MATSSAASRLERELIGREPAYDYLHTDMFFIKLHVPEDVSIWRTGPEAFRSAGSSRIIEGVPANLAVYRLLDGLPVFNLLEREGNLLASPGLRDETYRQIRGYGDWMPPRSCGDPMRDDPFKHGHWLPLRDDPETPFVASGRMLAHVMDAIGRGKSIETDYQRITGRGYIDRRFIDIEAAPDNTDMEVRLFQATMGSDSPGPKSSVTLYSPAYVRSILAARPGSAIVSACYLNTSQRFFIATNNFKIRQRIPG